MRLTATVRRVGTRFYAQCKEVDRAGEGRTPDEALANLRAALEEYYGEVPAVAPPPHPEIEPIEIVVTH
jgi:hypothetical protein